MVIDRKIITTDLIKIAGKVVLPLVVLVEKRGGGAISRLGFTSIRLLSIEMYDRGTRARWR